MSSWHPQMYYLGYDFRVGRLVRLEVTELRIPSNCVRIKRLKVWGKKESPYLDYNIPILKPEYAALFRRFNDSEYLR